MKKRATASHVVFVQPLFPPTHWHFRFAGALHPSPFQHTQGPAHARRTTGQNLLLPCECTPSSYQGRVSAVSRRRLSHRWCHPKKQISTVAFLFCFFPFHFELLQDASAAVLPLAATTSGKLIPTTLAPANASSAASPRVSYVGPHTHAYVPSASAVRGKPSACAARNAASRSAREVGCDGVPRTHATPPLRTARAPRTRPDDDAATPT